MVCWAHAGIITVILCSVLCASEAHAQFCTSNECAPIPNPARWTRAISPHINVDM